MLRVSHESGQQHLDVHQLIRIDVDQFYGIEIEEFPARIAQVALWLIDHQMNVRVSEEFGLYFARIPLKSTLHIHCANALRLEWNEVLPAERANYVFGNSPFVGAKFMNDKQRSGVAEVFDGIASGGLLDLVAAWYVKAAHYRCGLWQEELQERRRTRRLPVRALPEIYEPAARSRESEARQARFSKRVRSSSRAKRKTSPVVSCREPV
ncbi:protein of unknown function [Georgfuchsia toluolica]|uniref:MmeI-like DNA-methyltransferase domain-containing protein n=1 Tax=Georgfuchsia toluolica TaxID=424218 RepID=A0A916N397_9PROT|nr:DNA methyltransferase [Georgfuchsia toluolica]CAG4884754.1 protein of unknown function [Georgfuchsia toluolica]